MAGLGFSMRPGAAALLPRVGSVAGRTPCAPFVFVPGAGRCDVGGCVLTRLTGVVLRWPGAVALRPRSVATAFAGLARTGFGFLATTGVTLVAFAVLGVATATGFAALGTGATTTFAAGGVVGVGSLTALTPS